MAKPCCAVKFAPYQFLATYLVESTGTYKWWCIILLYSGIYIQYVEQLNFSLLHSCTVATSIFCANSVGANEQVWADVEPSLHCYPLSISMSFAVSAIALLHWIIFGQSIKFNCAGWSTTHCSGCWLPRLRSCHWKLCPNSKKLLLLRKYTFIELQKALSGDHSVQEELV